MLQSGQVWKQICVHASAPLGPFEPALILGFVFLAHRRGIVDLLRFHKIFDQHVAKYRFFYVKIISFLRSSTFSRTSTFFGSSRTQLLLTLYLGHLLPIFWKWLPKVSMVSVVFWLLKVSVVFSPLSVRVRGVRSPIEAIFSSPLRTVSTVDPSRCQVLLAA